MRSAAVLGAFTLATAALAQSGDDQVAQAKKRWAESPHGPMLERILPPTFEPRQLPDPGSRGARLLVDYCVQCHNLPNPAMHDAKKWPVVLERMVVRMRGRGNMGELMRDMMAGVQAPSEDEANTLLAYLRKNGQAPIDPKKYPELFGTEGRSFKLACEQCHVLPDPMRHTAAEWPAVVARMEKNMEWMNRVVGNHPPPDEPQLRIDEINAFLVKRARKD
ncbi:MAG TPA: hypothetical protein VFK92_08750 [Burkholderiales bacterium]|nr:hypothetical protein [Burkholderiales bacterium]